MWYYCTVTGRTHALSMLSIFRRLGATEETRLVVPHDGILHPRRGGRIPKNAVLDTPVDGCLDRRRSSKIHVGDLEQRTHTPQTRPQEQGVNPRQATRADAQRFMSNTIIR